MLLWGTGMGIRSGYSTVGDDDCADWISDLIYLRFQTKLKRCKYICGTEVGPAR